jgi:hypothetical protein
VSMPRVVLKPREPDAARGRNANPASARKVCVVTRHVLNHVKSATFPPPWVFARMRKTTTLTRRKSVPIPRRTPVVTRVDARGEPAPTPIKALIAKMPFVRRAAQGHLPTLATALGSVKRKQPLPAHLMCVRLANVKTGAQPTPIALRPTFARTDLADLNPMAKPARLQTNAAADSASRAIAAIMLVPGFVRAVQSRVA